MPEIVSDMRVHLNCTQPFFEWNVKILVSCANDDAISHGWHI